MNDLIAFSAANDVLAITTVAILFGLVLFLARTFREPGWYTRSEVQAFIALAVYFGSVGVGRMISAYLLYLREHKIVNPAIPIDASFRPVTIAYFGTIIGALCFIRVTYPVRWGNWPWIVTLIVSIVFGVLLRFPL